MAKPALAIAGLLTLVTVVALAVTAWNTLPSTVELALPPIPRAAPDAMNKFPDDLKPQLLVERNLPDFGSLQAIDQFDRARILSPSDPTVMFTSAWNALNLPANSRVGIEALGYELVSGPDIVTLPSRISSVMSSLRSDPLNAGRLCNAAVALFALGAALANEGSEDYLIIWLGALALLQATEASFPASRAVELDLALFLTWLDPQSAVAPLQRWLVQSTTDLMARLILARIQSRQVDGLSAARSTLQPLLEQPDTVSIGHAALGDALLEAWAQLRSAAPFTARRNARLALDEYDAALIHNRDPGLYAGRAHALDALDAPVLAAASQKIAVQRAPNSIDLRVGLIAYERESGALQAARGTAREALQMAAAWNPPLKGIRFVRTEDQTLGALGYSYGADSDHFPITPEGGKGGGYVVEYDLVPLGRTTGLDVGHHLGMATLVATNDTLGLDFVLDDPNTSVHEADAIQRQLIGAPGIRSGDPDFAGVVAAAQLAAGRALPPTTYAFHDVVGFGAAALRDAGRYRDAAAFCARAVRASPDARIEGLLCEAQAAYWATDYRESYRAFSAALKAIERDQKNPFLELQTAFVAAKAGATADARRLYSNAANDPVALEELGNLALDSGDSLSARDYYERAHRAVVEFQPPEGTDPLTSGVLSLKSSIDQRALNNRGIATLESLQTGTEQPPDCVRHRQECESAQSDFTSAMGYDAFNPLYMLNLAWVARLLGETGLEQKTLKSAVAMDPTLFPALNDLGVYKAGIGDRAAAETAFEAAIAANPNYDLAAWNLGVLQMREGLEQTLKGQAMLGRAIRLNPNLRSQPLEFKTDERIYRVAVAVHETPDGNLGRRLGLASGALGGLALLTAISLGVSQALKDTVLHRAGSLAAEHMEGLIASLERKIEGRLPHYVPWSAWLLTAPFLLAGVWLITWHEARQTLLPSVTLVLLAFIAAGVVHEVGHFLAASFLNVRVEAGASTLGIAISLAMLSFMVLGGPYVGHRIIGGTRPAIWWAAMAGPATNVLAGVALFLISLQYPMPAVRFAVLAQIIVASFSLLPFKPLDGAILMRSWPLVPGLISAAIGATGILITIGVI